MSKDHTAVQATPLRTIVYPVVPTDEQWQVHADAEQRGYLRGHALGHAAGLQQAREKAALERAVHDAEHEALLAGLRGRSAAQLAALAAAGAALAARTQPVLAESEATLIDCALTLAEAIVGRELGDGEASAQAILARVRDRGQEPATPLVRLNPQDLAAIGPEALEACGLNALADENMPAGDAVAEFPDGFLDARISTALDRARRALAEANP